MATISRNEYVGLYGPTVGDRIRLGDTGLFVEVERDMRGDPAKLTYEYVANTLLDEARRKAVRAEEEARAEAKALRVESAAPAAEAHAAGARRSGRPSHCYNCGETGHISRRCRNPPHT